MLVVGENEEQNGTISVRRRGEGDLGAMSIEDFVSYFKEESKIDDTLEILHKENIELTTENQRLKTEIQTLNEQIKDLSSYTFTYKVPKTSYYKIKLYEKLFR